MDQDTPAVKTISLSGSLPTKLGFCRRHSTICAVLPMKTIALLVVSAMVAASDLTSNVAATPQGVVPDAKDSQQHLRQGNPTEAQKKEWGLWGGLGGWGCGGLGIGCGCGGSGGWGLGCGTLGWGLGCGGGCI